MNPFQELSSEYLLNFFRNPSGNEETENNLYSSISTNSVPNTSSLSKVELVPSQASLELVHTNIDILFREALEHHSNAYLAVESITDIYKESNKSEFYPLVVELFRSIGYNCKLSRAGVNYQRWDAVIITPTYSIPIEVKSPGEEPFISVKAVRQALENKVIMLARHDLHPSNLEYTSLVVGYNPPNNRSEVITLVEDIFNAYHITIGVIDFRSLLKIAIERFSLGKIHNSEQLVRLYGIIELSDA
jgi:hypothetical protein